MFNTIVFAYDGSAECRDALEEGIALASRFNARCYLLAVILPLHPLALVAGPLPDEVIDEERSYVSTILEEGLARLTPGRGGGDGHSEDGRIAGRGHQCCRPRNRRRPRCHRPSPALCP